MKDQQPDQHTVLGAIALANRAPSVHNTQPWRWLLGNESIHLIADRARRLPATDVNGHDMLLSCGAALHRLRVALGWHANVRHLPNPNDPDHLAAVTTIPRTPSTKDIALDLMAERAAKAGALLLPVTDEHTRRQLTRAIDEAAGLQRTDAAYAAELATWSGRSRVSEDGVLAASTPAGPRTHGDTTMRAFPTGTLADTETGRDEDDGGELLVLATITDDLVSVLRAGEATSAALLTATSVGLAACPLSQALEIPGTRALIRDQVFDGAAFPHLILRIGWAPTAAPQPPQSPRRATHDTIDYLPGTHARHARHERRKTFPGQTLVS